MARIELTVTLNSMRTLVKAMREVGLVSWCGSPLGDLQLGAPPPPPRDTSRGEEDKNAARRQYYTEVLGRSVTDAELKNLP